MFVYYKNRYHANKYQKIVLKLASVTIMSTFFALVSIKALLIINNPYTYYASNYQIK